MRKLYFYFCMACMGAFLAACGNHSKSDKADEDAFPQKGDIKVVLEMDKTGLTPEEVDAAFDITERILFMRLDSAKLGIYSMERVEGGEPRLLIYARCKAKDRQRLLRQLTMRSQLEFWETYNGDELYSILQSIIDNSQLAPHVEAQIPLDSLNEMDRAIMEHEQQVEERNHGFQFMNMHMPVVGVADVRDTAYINQMIYSEHAKQVLSSLPWEVRFVWGAKPSDQYDNNKQKEMLELYALKVTDPSGHAPLDGSFIVNAKSTVDYNHSPAVSINMDTQGARTFAEITRSNLHRAIALVIDDVVYVAPTIQSEITNGAIQISGNFTQEEIDDLANLLNMRTLPVDVRIISYEEVE